jgi:hypothetical protein
MAAYTRCLRCAGAPRRPASGSELSLYILSWHAVFCDPGKSEHRQFQTAMSAWPSPQVNRLGTPKDPAIRFTREVHFGAASFTHSLRPARLLAPLYGSDRYSGRPPGTFTSRLSTGRSPFPLLDITTTATGPPCMGPFLSRSFGRAAHPLSFVGFFVRSGSPFLRPDPRFAHVDARRSCQGWPSRQPCNIPPVPGHTLTASSTTAPLVRSG